MKKSTQHRLILVALMVLFIAPGLCAYFAYQHAGWFRSNTINKGQLLDPPVLVSAMKARWHLVVWSPSSCGPICRKQLDTILRIRVALGRRLYDVDLLLLLGPDAPSMSTKDKSMYAQQGVQVVKADELMARHPTPAFFIANPDHYLVLTYPFTTKPDDIFHDMKHLLGSSNV